MYIGGNSKEIFELFTNKLVFSVSVSQRWRWRSWLGVSSLDTPLERSASSRIIMKEFLFSIWFISLSSNLKLSIYIFIMSVRHVFADFRLIFVNSCSRRDGASLFSLFYKIILYCIFYKILLILWVHTNKSWPFTIPNDVLLSPLWAKITT